MTTIKWEREEIDTVRDKERLGDKAQREESLRRSRTLTESRPGRGLQVGIFTNESVREEFTSGRTSGVLDFESLFEEIIRFVRDVVGNGRSSTRTDLVQTK